MRRILRVAQTALLGLLGLYAGDYLSARYRIPDDRQTLGSVQVKTLYAVRQKSGRIEYSVGDTETESCVRSLFPHLGYIPCWYLRRHSTKRIEISRVDRTAFSTYACSGAFESNCRQCIVDGPGVPSDQVPAKTMKMVTRSSGSTPAITGEPGRLAPQLFTASPETKNMT